MNIVKPSLLLAMSLFFCISCDNSVDNEPKTIETEITTENSIELPKSDYQRFRNGKIKNATPLSELFTPTNLDSLQFPEIDDNLVNALQNQLKALDLKKSKKPQQLASVEVTNELLQNVIETLVENADAPREILANYLDAYQVWGKDQKGHVKFTGYFSPEIKVKKTKDDVYKYPLYRKPKNWEGKLPSRKEIDGEGALQDLGLEIAYAANMEDIYYLQLQGSGYAKFVDSGQTKLLRFGGGNGHKYRSIERFIMKSEDIKLSDISINGVKRFIKRNPELRDTILFSNPSYAFFKYGGSKIKGSAGVALDKDISIAVDPKYFPIGSVILASVPTYDSRGDYIKHEPRILLPQDVGGAIRGPGHVDIYSGIGLEGEKNASNHHHYGRMWLLMPKEHTQLASK